MHNFSTMTKVLFTDGQLEGIYSSSHPKFVYIVGGEDYSWMSIPPGGEKGRWKILTNV